jgi:hypothetical protein
MKQRELVINFKAARAIYLDVLADMLSIADADMLSIADEVIE